VAKESDAMNLHWKGGPRLRQLLEPGFGRERDL